MRLGLDLLKPELIQAEHRIRSTIAVFSSARPLEPSLARLALEQATAESLASPQNRTLQQRMAVAERRLALAPYYDKAREFGRLVSAACQTNGRCEYVIFTGGGPGIMKAANRRAADASAKSIGLNMTLPHEQYPNPDITPDLLSVSLFTLRKMHFLLGARALVVFRGAFSILDEPFETLTLLRNVQYHHRPRRPGFLGASPQLVVVGGGGFNCHRRSRIVSLCRNCAASIGTSSSETSR